jgi:Rrf2 family protein
MKITAVEEYGMRCVLRLAKQPEGGPLTVAEIAQREGLTAPHVGKLMAILKQSNLVDSVRGRSGGYTLARPATEITVEEVLNALGEPLFDRGYCESHPGSLDVCRHQGDCSIRSVWQVLAELIHTVLRGTSLADLCRQEEEVSRHLEDRRQPAMMALGVESGGGSGPGIANPATD